MKWIVWKEENGKIKLISKQGTTGMLPKGSYLTVEDEGVRFILRVDDSKQTEPFEPSPLIADMDLSGLNADRQCKNIVLAYRVKTISDIDDGLIRYIRPLSEARRSTQEEVDRAMDSIEDGPKVFVATLYANENQILRDQNNNYITAKIPEDFYFYQTMICGKTGSGKTVAMKYLSQYFVEKIGGAVLAINVKGDDFLHMDCPSGIKNKNIVAEWDCLGEKPRGINKFTVYYPARRSIPNSYRNITAEMQSITLNVNEIEPEALTGALSGITDKAAALLPGIFRNWRYENEKKDLRFSEFISYITRCKEDRSFKVRNENGDVSDISIHPMTIQSIITCLESASEFFDRPDSVSLNAEDILNKGKMSVIDVADNTKFGAIILRDILKKLVQEKDQQGPYSKVKLLIIIDEVHQFYDSTASRASLSYLDTICRTGRSKEIGVFFASQNPSDMPAGISSVVNSKFFFKTDMQSAKEYGVKISTDELEGLKSGYAVASIHDMPQLRIVKFPLSYSGVDVQ